MSVKDNKEFFRCCPWCGEKVRHLNYYSWRFAIRTNKACIPCGQKKLTGEINYKKFKSKTTRDLVISQKIKDTWADLARRRKMARSGKKRWRAYEETR